MNDPSKMPRTATIKLEPYGAAYADSVVFSGLVPVGIIGGTYKAWLKVLWAIGSGASQQDVAVPAAHDIAVEDDSTTAIPEAPQVLVVE